MVGPPDDEPLPDPVARTIEAHRERAGSGPLLYCSFGSIALNYRGGLLREVIAAVADRPGWRLLLALGRTADPAGLGELPANVTALGWMPQRTVLDEVDLAITRAGLMTVVECAVAGVPMLVHSAGNRDQDGNAARVAHHGLGALGREDDRAPTIRRNIEQLLDDDAVAARVAAMRETLRHDDGVAGRAVGELLRR